MALSDLLTEEKIALTLLPGIGPVMQRRLVQHFGDFASIVRAGPARLARITGLESSRFALLKDHAWQRHTDAELDFCERHRVTPVCFGNERYPITLADCHDAPLVMYCLGSTTSLGMPGVAVVGTREATDYGKRMSHRLSQDLSKSGCAVISGLARGIDLAAHQGCMEAGGHTIAVLGHGLHLIYPARHRPVAAAIVESGGCLLTEFVHTTPFNPGNFPSRNRIIAGLARATVVVEARATGGALITAQLADGYQRDVFAIPGHVDSPFSQGCHELIRSQVARIATGASDILDGFGTSVMMQGSLLAPPPPAEPLTEAEARVLQHLSMEALHVDVLLDKSGLEAADLLARLMFLEMKGVIEALPGKYYRKRLT